MLRNKKKYNSNNLTDDVKTFNDGVCTIYACDERVLRCKKGKFYFANESVGMNHYWQAYNNNIGIDRAISVPLNEISIDPQDVVKIDGHFYNISRVQYHDNYKPHYWTLSLSRSTFAYGGIDD